MTKNQLMRHLNTIVKEAKEEVVPIDDDGPSFALMELEELLHTAWEERVLSSEEADDLSERFTRLINEAQLPAYARA